MIGYPPNWKQIGFVIGLISAFYIPSMAIPNSFHWIRPRSCCAENSKGSPNKKERGTADFSHTSLPKKCRILSKKFGSALLSVKKFRADVALGIWAK